MNQTTKISVNMNGIRRNFARAYTRLCKKLNDGIEQDAVFSSLEISDPETLQEEMDDLRNGIVTLLCMYQDNDDSFQMMIDEFDLPVYFEQDD